MLNSSDPRTTLQQLVDRFQANRAEYIRRSSGYNETLLRNDFLNPLLQLLGWDVFNRSNAPQHLREVILEDVLEVDDDGEESQEKPDYALRLGGERKFFVEAKKPSVDIHSHAKSAFQTRRYGWNARMPISVLTNFDRLIIYDCRPLPKAEDDARVARIRVFSYTDYVEQFDEIYALLSRESVYSGQFDAHFPVDKEIAGTEPFDEYFLGQIERWRLALATSLFHLNPNLTQEELNFLVQRLINRIVFLRICEDRTLEKYKSLQSVKTYEDLKSVFRRADERYNSGLFDFIEDKLSLKVQVPDETLIEIFRELYYPESPYAFSVVETSLLGQIYEHFLAREVRIGSTVEIVEKPEVIASGGVVSTPRFVVDNIVRRTLQPLVEGKSLAEIRTLSIADIACGSGTFLLSAFEYMLSHYLAWYVKDGAQNHQNAVYEGVNQQWHLTLYEKQRILQTHIYGVDIDHQAVEVARFSLLLRVVEGETQSSVEAHLKKYSLKALPNLRNNIKWGNSLVDDAFFEYNPAALGDENLIYRLNPFNWEEGFQSVMAQGGFDAIVGNPPYIRIQNMVHYSPEEATYYQSRSSPYVSSKSDNFDKYSLFIERALSLAKPYGCVGYIVSHKFMTLKSGKALRALLATNRQLAEITHFGVEQVFGKRVSTYTCILILSKLPTTQFSVDHVIDLNLWRYAQEGIRLQFDTESLSDAPWLFVSPQAEALFHQVEEENPTTLSVVTEILVGVQTSADKIFIVRAEAETTDTITFIDRNRRQWEIEKAACRPCIYKATLSAFSTVRPNAYIIFPYRAEDGEATLYSEVEMMTLFPKCWAYLNSYKAALFKRDVQGFTEDTWYRFGRSQSLTRFEEGEKLIWSTLTLFPRYAYDNRNVVFTGGGNGPYYGLRMRHDQQLSLYYIQAILSHPLIELMVSARASEFRGGYKSHGKQFIQGLPIRTINFDDPAEAKVHDEIVGLVQQLIRTVKDSDGVTLPHELDRLDRQKKRLKRRIDQLIANLYNVSPEDLSRVPELQEELENEI
jgi:type I restriction-modification system DNA methylase subunit